MTTVDDPAPCTSLEVLTDQRTDVELALAQLSAIEAWTSAHRSWLQQPAAGLSREERLELARRRDVVDRQRQALHAWTAQQLRQSGALLRTAATTRAVVVHRNAWFRSKVTHGLHDGGIGVVADLDNGADAVGVVVAEQPDVLLLEDELPMVSGLSLCRAARTWAPRTVLAVQVDQEGQVGPFLDAGATTVFTRRSRPAEIAAQLVAAAP